MDPKVARRVWRLAEPLLSPAFDEDCDDTIEVVRRDVEGGISLLWIAWDGREVVAAAVTVIIHSPRHKICAVSCAGGINTRLWDLFMPMVENYAKAEGCDLVRVMGRKGWARVLDGYRQPWIVLDKRI